jgi:anti-sigma B factor antagonist
MLLHIKSEQTSDVAVLQCAGRMVRAEELHLLKDAVTSLTHPRVIVLDLSGVEMLDGAGLGMLVFLHSWTRDNGIQLTLVNPSNFAREMLELTRLTCVLHISSMGDAVEVLCNSDSTTENENRAVA